MGISEIYSGQAAKENSPTSGLFKFLVARGGIDQGRGCLILLLDYLLKIPLIESHSQLYAKMRTILIKHICHLRCFSHLALTAQPFSA